MVRHRRLDVMPNYRWSLIARIGGRQSWDVLGVTWEAFQWSYRPEGIAGHLKFALKYDGVSFEILRAWFDSFEPDDAGALVEWLRQSPTSAYARRAWFLYEHLTERRLPVSDASTGAYAPLLPTPSGTSQRGPKKSSSPRARQCARQSALLPLGSTNAPARMVRRAASRLALPRGAQRVRSRTRSSRR